MSASRRIGRARFVPKPLLLILVIGLGCLGGCSKEVAESSSSAEEPAASEARAVVVKRPTEPLFFDVTKESGLDWHHQSGAYGQRLLPETMGPGVLVVDVNDDSWLDLIFVNGGRLGEGGEEARPSALFLNQGGLRFQEATSSWGMPTAYCLGGVAGDIDNDGDADVVLTCLGRDLLLRNEGDHFVEVGETLGLVAKPGSFSASALLFDADHDGWLDLYIARYVQWDPASDQTCELFGQGKSYCTPGVYPADADRFYRNLGGERFEDQTEKAGLLNLQAKSLGVTGLDVDQDGWTDLMIACDTTRNFLFRNRGDGTFEELGEAMGIAYSVNGDRGGGMGIDAADVDRTGMPGLAMTQFEDEMVALLKNHEGAFFLDQALNSEVGIRTMPYVGWGTFFFDYDLDGWLDLFVANGHLDPQADTSPGRSPWAQPQQLFWNENGKAFRDVTETVAGDLGKARVGRGAAFADLDQDGDLDVVLTTSGGPALLFENRLQAANWVQIGLEGRQSNRDAIGTRVILETQDGRQSSTVKTGASYLSQSQMDLTFGLGAEDRIRRLEIHWPSGEVEVLTDVPAKQRLSIKEKESRGGQPS